MQNATTTKTKIIIKNAVEIKRNFLISFIPWKSFGALHTCWLRYLDNLVQAFCRLRDRRKKGRGEGKEKGAPSLTLSPQSPSLSPSSQSPTPFDACYAGYPCVPKSAPKRCVHTNGWRVPYLITVHVHEA